MTDELLSSEPQAGQLLSSDPTANAAPSAPQSEHPILTAIATLTGAGMPVLRSLMEHLATSPMVPKAAATIGRGVGAITSLPASFGGFGSIARGSWQGGKAGWFTGKLAQEVAAPIAKYATALEPYMPALMMLSQEGDTLGQLNSPESIGQLAKTLKPEQRAKILNYYKDQPDYLKAIMRAIQR